MKLLIISMLFVSVFAITLFTWWQHQLISIVNMSWESLPPDLPPLTLIQVSPSIAQQISARPLFWEARRPITPTKTERISNNNSKLELLGIVTEGETQVAIVRPFQGGAAQPVRRLHLGNNPNAPNVLSIERDQITMKSSQGIETLTLKRGSANPIFNLEASTLTKPQQKNLPTPSIPAETQKQIDELKEKFKHQTPPTH